MNNHVPALLIPIAVFLFQYAIRHLVMMIQHLFFSNPTERRHYKLLCLVTRLHNPPFLISSQFCHILYSTTIKTAYFRLFYSFPSSFNPAIPTTISIIHMTCGTDSFSWKRKTPSTDVPIIPNPVHIAYAVPNGRFFNAIDRNTALSMYPTIVITDGITTVNPSENFMAIAVYDNSNFSHLVHWKISQFTGVWGCSPQQ